MSLSAREELQKTALPSKDASAWYGLGVPNGTPPEIIDKLSKETNAILADHKVKARFADIGATLLAGLARRFRQARCRRDRKVGKGGQVRRH
jgi:hypothetical protein